MEDAAIVCSTLSFAGSELFGKEFSRDYDAVVIDEASQVNTI